MDKLNQILQAGVTTPYSKPLSPPNRTGIAAPLSPMDLEKIKRQQYSPDPVIANLQKLGRGMKDFIVPDTPIEALGILGAPAKAAATVGSGLLKSVPGKKQYLYTPDIPKSQEIDFITSTQAAIKSPEDLYNTSTKLNPGFQAEVKSIADNLGLEKAPKFKMSGGKTIDVEVKSLESIQDKALRKQGNVQKITDGIRTRIYVNKPADSDKVVAQLNKKYDVIDEGEKLIKNTGFQSRGVKIKYVDDAGDSVIAEVQLISKPMAEAADKTHKYYTIQRSLREKALSQGKEVSEDLIKKETELFNIQRKIYDEARKKIDPSFKKRIVTIK
jgi:hypothetical protein